MSIELVLRGMGTWSQRTFFGFTLGIESHSRDQFSQFDWLFNLRIIYDSELQSISSLKNTNLTEKPKHNFWQQASKISKFPNNNMASLYDNRSEKKVGFEKQPSEKDTITEKWTTEQKEKATTGNRGTEAAYPSFYESLLSQEAQKQEPFFNRMMYYSKSILLVLIFLTAAASLALNLSQLNLPSGMFS